MPPGRVVGVVLAGGASRRFGSDKLGAMLDGRPLLLRAIDALDAVDGLERVIVAGPASPFEPDWLPAVVAAGADVVRDEEAFGGPLAGLAVALDALADADVAIVVGGDMPRLDPTVLGDLVRAIERGAGADVAFLASDGERHPLPLAVSVGPGRHVARKLLERGERSLRAYLEEFEGGAAWAAFDQRSIADVDTPDDLRALRTWRRSEPGREASGPGTGST